jgi:hypothetical protein
MMRYRVDFSKRRTDMKAIVNMFSIPTGLDKNADEKNNREVLEMVGVLMIGSIEVYKNGYMNVYLKSRTGRVIGFVRIVPAGC